MIELSLWCRRIVVTCLLLDPVPKVAGFASSSVGRRDTHRSTSQHRRAHELRATSVLDSTGCCSFWTAAVASSTGEFAPVMPDSAALVGFGSVVLLCAVAAYVWATQVVPVSRTKLARSKQSGPVREYLDDLAEEETRRANERSLERWLFTDWLEGPKRKESALPILKKAKWNSGDNPVLVATALILLGVILTSLIERIAALP